MKGNSLSRRDVFCYHSYLDTEVIWGVNFGQNNLTAAIVEATSIMQAFSGPEISNLGISLKFLEIGNEPGKKEGISLEP